MLGSIQRSVARAQRTVVDLVVEPFRALTRLRLRCQRRPRRPEDVTGRQIRADQCHCIDEWRGERERRFLLHCRRGPQLAQGCRARRVALGAAYWGEAAAPVCVPTGQPLTHLRPRLCIAARSESAVPEGTTLKWAVRSTDMPQSATRSICS